MVQRGPNLARPQKDFFGIEVRGPACTFRRLSRRVPVLGEMLEVWGGGLREGCEGCFGELGSQPG